MASFTFVRDVAAPPETLFELFTDHRHYAEMTRLRSSELEREGDPAPNGVGAVRVLKAPGMPALREEILTYESPSRYSYSILSGAPVREHVGTVELTPAGGGTRVTYAVRAIPKSRLASPMVMTVMKMAVKQLLDGVCAEAERRSS